MPAADDRGMNRNRTLVVREVLRDHGSDGSHGRYDLRTNWMIALVGNAHRSDNRVEGTERPD